MKMKGVECPECGSLNTPSRSSNLDIENNRIRKRECQDCGEWFTTAEIPVPGFSFAKAIPTRSPDKRRVDPSYLRVKHGDKGIAITIVEPRRVELCRKGLHVFSGQNIYVNRNGQRQCRACRNAGAREAYHNARRKAPPSILEEQRRKWREAHRRRAA
jgi:hypothetical protein